MEVVIDKFEDSSQWLASGAGIVLSENGFKSHIIEGDSSLRIKVDTADGQYFERVFAEPVDLTGCDTLRFFLSKHTDSGLAFIPQNFCMKVAVGNTVTGVFTKLGEWYVPIINKSTMKLVNIDLGGILSFNTIRFTVVGNYLEVFWLDYIIGCKDEFVIDTLLAIAADLNEVLRFPRGTLPSAVSAGASSVSVADWMNISKYSLVVIEEGSVIEKHQVAGEVVEGVIQFTHEYDGEVLLNSFTTAARVYLVVPCTISNKNSLMVVPGIYISGFVPFLPEGSLAGKVYDSFKTDGFVREIEVGRDVELPVLIEVRSAQAELMVAINNFIQGRYTENGLVLVNGITCDVMVDGSPDYDDGSFEDEVPYTLHPYRVKVQDSIGAVSAYIKYHDSSKYVVNLNE